MNKNSPISGIMTKEVIVAHLDNKFSQLMEFFNTWRIQHLPVTLGEKLIGIVSINDMLAFSYHRLSSGESVSYSSLDAGFDMKQVMTQDPTTISPNDSIEDAFRILGEGKFQSLPVVENGKLVGIVTNKDLVKNYRALL